MRSCRVLSEALGPERPVSAANKSGKLARAARERSELERESQRLTAGDDTHSRGL